LRLAGWLAGWLARSLARWRTQGKARHLEQSGNGANLITAMAQPKPRNVYSLARSLAA